MESITADNLIKLLMTLKDIDISVPLRTEGRTTEHCERWSICRFLASVAHTGLIQYPCEVTHEDKPDFVLKHRAQTCGIEVTEVVPENAAAIDALREHREIDGPFFHQKHFLSDPKLKGRKLLAKALSNEPEDGWAGDAVEKDWVDAIQTSIQAKINNAGKDGFRTFQKNWLLMYDGLHLPKVNGEEAAKLLCASMNSETYELFEYIFIESSSSIWIFSSDNYAAVEINDLW